MPWSEIKKIEGLDKEEQEGEKANWTLMQFWQYTTCDLIRLDYNNFKGAIYKIILPLHVVDVHYMYTKACPQWLLV